MPEMQSGDTIYTAEESQPNYCPVCGGENLEFHALEVLNEVIQYPWECNDCGTKGEEHGIITFDGHKVFSKVEV
jgi:C4-type Zn-finger protein